MTKIKEVAPKADHRLEVTMENGSQVILDFTQRLETIRFGRLADDDFFEKVTTNGDLILWDSEVEISLREVFQLVEQ